METSAERRHIVTDLPVSADDSQQTRRPIQRIVEAVDALRENLCPHLAGNGAPVRAFLSIREWPVFHITACHPLFDCSASL